MRRQAPPPSPAGARRRLLGLLICALLAAPPAATACPAHQRQLLAADRAALKARLEGLAVPGKPLVVAGPAAEVGRWGPVEGWPVTPIHSVLLPTGEVLAYSYPYENPRGSDATLWDPRSGTFTPVDMERDLFCSGHSLLPDGRLFASGGNNPVGCEFRGTADAHLFDPRRRRWTRLEDMAVGRWYPTNVALGDGRVVITAGLGDDCEPTPVMELYTPGEGIEVVRGGRRELALYPRLFLLSSGLIAHVGPEADTWTFDLESERWQHVTHSRFYRWDGSAVLVPGRTDEVLAVGGGDPPVAGAERIDFGAAAPRWRPTASLNLARAHHDLVILPDRTVLAVGGGLDGLYGDPVFVPELYDPEAETWTLLPPHALGRMYHSTSVLLPDGRVLVAGQDDGLSTFTAELYQPAYLFRGPRPQIAGAPGLIGYGSSFTLTSPQAAEIAAVSLVAPSSVTHSVNVGQRLVDLPFVRAGGERLRVTGPAGPNHAPPGYYMLFLLDGDGVPSVAAWLRLAPGAVFGDGFEGGRLSAWSRAD